MFSASLYEAVFNSSPLSTALLSPTPDATIMAVNDAFLEKVCRSREALTGKSLFEALPEITDDVGQTGTTALRNSLVQVIENGKPDTLPTRRHLFQVTAPTGEIRNEEQYLIVTNKPILDADGKLLCIAHSITDVTQQVQAEAALQKSEAHYWSLFDSIDEGFCVIEMMFNEQGHPIDYRFCETNRMFAVHTGFQDAEGKTMRELIPQHEQHWFDIYGRVAKTGESIRFQNEAKALGRWYDLYAFRIDEPGTNRVAVLFTDITGQRQAEEDLRKSEQQALEAARQAQAERQRLDAVVQATPVAIAVSDAQGATLLTNTARKKLWGAQHPMPKGIDDFHEWKGWWADGSDRHGQRLKPHEWTLARVLHGMETINDIIEIESFDIPPVRRIIMNSAAPIKDSHGNITGAVIAQMDITDRVKAEQALKQADRRKDEFLAMLAHELRNPLAPLAAAADLLRIGHLDQAQIAQTSAIISRQVTHMAGLVDDLLDVSRVTRGLIVLDKTRLDAKRIVADAVEQVRPLIEARNHRLAIHMAPEAAWVLGDHKRLVQVMANLLTNAAKYTSEGGDIVLGLEADEETVKMSVIDTGVGMSADMLDRAFDLFTQAERTSDRSLGGLGIGLALVKSLMELHGGSVTAWSEGTGKGSRFTVCIPHFKDAAGASHKEQDAVLTTTAVKRLKTMVVDDNVDAAQMLAMFLEALGHQVVVEHNSRKALERARLEAPQVCLLDIGLPDMDGNELARRLRTQPETAEAVLVAVTGYGQEHDRRNASDAGFDHHFVKPVDTTELARLLNDLRKR